jgi:hypothetical protein
VGDQGFGIAVQQYQITPRRAAPANEDTSSIVTLVISGAGFVFLPQLQALAFYLPIFAMDPNIRFHQFSALGLLAVLLSVPASIVAGIIFRRRRREHRRSALALAGLALGVLTMFEMVVLYLALHSHLL